jgi:hypothetical protein
MKPNEIRKLLKEAAGPTPLPPALRKRLEGAIQDEASRAAFQDVEGPEPLSPLLRKRLERQLTAPSRARKAYRRFQVFSSVAASVIVLALGVSFVATGGDFTSWPGDGSPRAANSPDVKPTSKASPTKRPGKPTTGVRKADPLPSNVAAEFSAKADEIPAQAPLGVDDPEPSGRRGMRRSNVLWEMELREPSRSDR